MSSIVLTGIDETKPEENLAYTADVRANFADVNRSGARKARVVQMRPIA